ncbi:MAG: hypothetical protein HY300_00405 [Verrucomicrobia bacterium]|nr:hypothetical protein [Verrucomicrobiota bacterium]
MKDNFQTAKFLEHWGVTLICAIIGVLAGQILPFFVNLNGASWIYFFVASGALMISGGALIAYAKFPVYRNGRFFTFGAASVPDQLTGFYRWGWRLFLFGAILSLCLLFSKSK